METEEISLFPFFYAPNSQCTISCLRNELWALDRHYKKTIQGNLFFKNPRSFGIRAKLQIVGCKLVWVDLILKNHLMLWFGPFYVLNQRSKIFFCPLCLKLCFSNLCPPSGGTRGKSTSLTNPSLVLNVSRCSLGRGHSRHTFSPAIKVTIFRAKSL